MTYFAYKSRCDGPKYSFEDRTLTPDEEPVAKAFSLEELKVKARAYLGEEPAELLYLTNAENHVLEMMLNKKHHQAMELAWSRITFAIALLVFATTCLLAALGVRALWALLSFVGISALYCAIVKSKIYGENKVESAVMCEIILILGFLLASAILQAREAANGAIGE